MKKNIIIIVLSIVALLLAGTVGYFIAEKVIIREFQKNNNNSQEENISNNCEQDSIPKCYGTYYGEASGQYDNGLTYNFKYTYTLKEDGTFITDFNGVSGTQGTFVINDNTISLIGMKDVAGPEDAHYATTDLFIAEDCSYILYDRTINFKLFKQ